jgi:cytochrome c oxidase subunit 2
LTLGDAFSGWPPPTLDPAGPNAEAIALMAWVLFGVLGLVLLLVLVAVALALFGRGRGKKTFARERTIWALGVALPSITLAGFLVYGLVVMNDLSEKPQPGDLRIRITGEMWWWRVVYLDADGRELFHDANELHIPVGRPVTLELTSADVIHSFWAPELAGKVDMIPGRINILRIRADRPGRFGGACAEYCGGPHALMGFVAAAHAPADFDALIARRSAAARAPVDALRMAGQQVFLASGCGACHTVRGTSANGLAGPDLTNVGARLTLGAGILPNNRGTLGGWVSNADAIKPGVRMPPYPMLDADELQAISAYLENLK